MTYCTGGNPIVMGNTINAARLIVEKAKNIACLLLLNHIKI
jgi:hypothetical protein